MFRKEQAILRVGDCLPGAGNTGVVKERSGGAKEV